MRFSSKFMNLNKFFNCSCNFHQILKIEYIFSVVTKYCDKLPRDCGISLFTCNGVFVDDFLLESDKNLGLAFFLPRFPPSKLSFSIQTINSEDIRECDPSMLAEELVKETVTDDDNHNCLLFFKSEDIERRTKNFKDFEESILTGLRKRYKPGKFSLLGCSFAEIYTKDSQNSKMCPDLHGEDEPKWIFLRVSGKSLQSWSLALENSLSTQDKKNKLLKFKENVIIKPSSFALVVNPMTSVSDVDEYFEELFTDLVVFEIQSASAASGQYCIDSSVSGKQYNSIS